jgi:hypothetical protein
MVVVDATECVIRRPCLSWFQTMTYSGYKKKNTLKYEVAICEESGLPISYSGPFSGPTADISIFRSSLLDRMVENDWYGLADGTYHGEGDRLLVPPRPYHGLSFFEKCVYSHLAKRRVIIENFLWRVKSFDCVNQRFRHESFLHHFIFHAVVNLVAIDVKFRPIRK